MAAVNIDIECIVGSLHIRTSDGTHGATTGSVLSQGEVVTVTEKSDSSGWYKLEDGRGWVSGGSAYVKVVASNDDTKTVESTDTSPLPDEVLEDPTINASIVSAGLDDKLIDMLYDKAVKGDSRNLVDSSTRLFGAPHQFIRQTDFRVNKGQFQLGRKYLQSIISEAPIVYFMPGKPNYLPEADPESKSKVLEWMSNLTDAAGDIKKIVNKVNGGDTRYYNLVSDYSGYMRYVNLLCRSCAMYIGLGDSTAPGTTTPYKKYNWANYRYEATFKEVNTDSSNRDLTKFFDINKMINSATEAFMGNYQYTQYFADPSLSFNESSSNNTSQSRMEGLFDTAEGIAKELAFIMDSSTLEVNDAVMKSFEGGMDAIKGTVGSGDGIIKRLLGAATNIVSGSNMIFPQIWGDSTYNKSYNITVNLVSPYGDRESIYLNCIVPLMHILAMAMPRQTSANSYASPFLVRVFSKGWFSCEMGIIDSLTIEKGGQGAWTADGLPSEIRVSIGVRDMYSNLMVTSSTEPDLFLNNGGLIEFLSVTCGVDISRPQYELQFKNLLMVFTNTITDIPANWIISKTEALKNAVGNLFILKKFMK